MAPSRSTSARSSATCSRPATSCTNVVFGHTRRVESASDSTRFVFSSTRDRHPHLGVDFIGRHGGTHSHGTACSL
jgi:hypothetical protein